MILPFISPSLRTSKKGQTTTHDWRFISSLPTAVRTSSPTMSNHCNLPVGPLPIAAWNVNSCAPFCRFRIAWIASRRKTAS
jgi:hypothetical protein